MCTEHVIIFTSSYGANDETVNDRCIPVLHKLLDDHEIIVAIIINQQSLNIYNLL